MGIYYVRSWEDDSIIARYENLNNARRRARLMGHDGIDSPYLTGYAPMARVSNDKGECVYDPRFKKVTKKEVEKNFVLAEMIELEWSEVSYFETLESARKAFNDMCGENCLAVFKYMRREETWCDSEYKPYLKRDNRPVD